MWINTVKEKIEAGGVVFGPILTEFYSPEYVEFLGYLGFDFVFIDGEHGGVGPETCRALVRAATNAGITPGLRVPSCERGVIQRYIDTGVQMIMAPHINTKRDAEELARSVKFYPVGHRGAASTARSAHYGLTQTYLEYITEANLQTWAVPLLEEAQAIDRLSEMLTVSELDLIQLGPGDMAMGMGYPGQPDHPEVRKLINQAITQIRGAGKPVGTVARTAEQAKQLIDQGVQMILVPFAVMIAQMGREYLKQVRIS